MNEPIKQTILLTVNVNGFVGACRGFLTVCVGLENVNEISCGDPSTSNVYVCEIGIVSVSWTETAIACVEIATWNDDEIWNGSYCDCDSSSL